jgi:hypothetical protein
VGNRGLEEVDNAKAWSQRAGENESGRTSPGTWAIFLGKESPSGWSGF